MGVHPMHVKSDSEVTATTEVSSPPRSPRRPLYYVQSPSHSQQLSYGSSPFASPPTHHHYQYHCSPIHHSKESSTSRFSASLKNPKAAALAWKRIDKDPNDHRLVNGLMRDDEDDDQEEGVYGRGKKAGQPLKFYLLCFLLCFVVFFTLFSVILWAASLAYQPKIFVKNIVFESFNVQAGMDGSGVPTDMLTLNSTVKIFFRNPATFFGVHVIATPLQFHYLDLMLASGLMENFYQSRKSQHIAVVVVQGSQVPLHGGVPALSGSKIHLEKTAMVPLNLTFQMRSRAYILGRLVKSDFYRSILCKVALRGSHLGKAINLTNSDHCVYR